MAAGRSSARYRVWMRRNPRREIFECGHCGADVPVGSAACRECGSDPGTGWQSADEIDYASVDLPSGYADDAGHPGATLTDRRPRWVAVVALLLVVLFVVALVWR